MDRDQNRKEKVFSSFPRASAKQTARKDHAFFLLVILCFWVLACFFSSTSVFAENYLRRYADQITELQIPAEKSGRLKVRVTLVSPKTPTRGNLLVLPGWKFHRHRWLKETRLIPLSEKYGLRLICPEMYTSVYASRYFPQTRMKWNPTPGLVWIRDFLVPFFQEKNILLKNQQNYLLGLSTGGRGVALIALEMPTLFRAAAAFSGDYDQSRMPRDRLMTAVYGPFSKFPKRWKEIDNPLSRASDWSLPVYLAHGTRDRVVPFSQTRLFYEALRKAQPKLRISFSAPSAEHNFRFWASELPKALAFLTATP